MGTGDRRRGGRDDRGRGGAGDRLLGVPGMALLPAWLAMSFGVVLGFGRLVPEPGNGRAVLRNAGVSVLLLLAGVALLAPIVG
jgi:hypothetical protein